MVIIDVGDPKMAREMLCRLQWLSDAQFSAFPSKDSPRIQELIDQLDVHRPLGPDGKHGDRHTDTCGCEREDAANSIHISVAKPVRSPDESEKGYRRRVLDWMIDEEIYK